LLLGMTLGNKYLTTNWQPIESKIGKNLGSRVLEKELLVPDNGVEETR